MSDSARNTVLITETLWRAVMRVAFEQSDVDTKAINRRAREIVTETLVDHLDRTRTLSEADRPCYVGTLVRYPGRAGSRSEFDPVANKVRVRETLMPGSKRLHLSLDTPTYVAAVECGLVLPYQWVGTGLAPASAERDSAAGARLPANRGRPLTDCVLAALTRRFGRSDDGLMANVGQQIVTQQTAQMLWKAAARSGPPDAAVAALLETLPDLLRHPEAATQTTKLLLGGWGGSLADLRKRVDQDPEMDPLTLF